ncbi:hypothetical protein ACFX2A_004201 [Malus domestica]
MPCNPHVYDFSNFTSLFVGPHLYIIGDSLFDTRSFPIDRPSPSSVVFLFDFSTSSPRCTVRKFFLHCGSKIGRDFRHRWRIPAHFVQCSWKSNKLSGAV